MQNKLSNRASFNKNFTLVDGSNYKVVMSFGREEVITFDHFKSLANSLFKQDAVFVTINNAIVQSKDIRIIEPTKEKTKQERLLLEEQQKKEQEHYQLPREVHELPSYKELLSKKDLTTVSKSD